MSVLEAMASGLPVVATQVGDVPRLVEDGVTGSIVPARDPQRLADALERLLRDPLLARNMGAAGRAAVQERFASTMTVDLLSELYSELQRAPR